MGNSYSSCKCDQIQLTNLNELFFSNEHRLTTILTIIYYLRSAWTNPGYLQGCAADEAKKAGAYDPKMYASGPENLTIDMSAIGQYNNGNFSGDGDISVISQNFDDISPTGAN